MSKRNRQKKQEAKIQRRRQRQKRAEKHSARAVKQDPLQEMMAEMAAEEAFADMPQVINPPGQEKMSEVFEQFIDPYLDGVDDVEPLEKLAALATVAWNAAIMADDQRASFLESILNTVPEEAREDFAQVVAEMIQRKHRHFADNRRQIVNVRVTEIGDGFHIAVASLMPSEGM